MTRSMVLGARSAARIGGRLLLAALTAMVVASVVAPGIAEAATIDQQVSREVTLDSPGTSTINAFDPAQGTLTQVTLTIDVEVLVQACVENSQEVGATTAGTATGSLAVELPAGANSTVAAAEAALPEGDLTASNGTDDCIGGFAAATGRFPAPVSAPDAAYAEDAGQASRTATLTARADLAPFIGTGTVTIAHTPDSDTELAVPAPDSGTEPAAWDAVSVAAGSYEVAVTYTYTPTPAATGTRAGTGSTAGSTGRPAASLSRTGSSAAEEAVVAGVLVLVGVTAVVIANRRQRTSGS